MSAQLLGPNTSLNAPGGLPGAAPTLLQGALVVGGGTTVNGNELVNGTLTVVQPQAGGTRTVYFTDGNSGPLESSVSVFNDQTATTLSFRDDDKSGNLTYNGAIGLLGEFELTTPTRLPELRTDLIVPSVGPLLSLGIAGEVKINASAAGGGARALNITDNQVGAALSSVDVFLNQTQGPLIQYNGQGTGGVLSYLGNARPTAPGLNGPGLFSFDKPVNHPVAQCGITGPTTPSGTPGIFSVAVSVPGLTGTGIVVVSPSSAISDIFFSIVDPAGGSFVVSEISTTGGARFSYFVAQY